MAVRYTSPHRSKPSTPQDGGQETFTQAVRAHGAGQVVLAMELYEKLLGMGAAQTKVLELAGIACMQLGRYPAAHKYLRQGLQKDSSNLSILNNLGVTLKHLGEYEEAASTLRMALEQGPGSPETLNNLGTVLESLDDIAGAVRAYLSALAIDQNNAAATANLRRIVGSQIAATAVLSTLEARKDSLSLGERELLCFARQAVSESQALSWEEALLLQLQDAQGKAERGNAAAAIEAYRAILEKHPEQTPAWNNLGVLLRQVKDYVPALHAFKRAIELDPAWALAWNNLGSCHLDLGDRQQARAALDQAERLAPELANVQCNLGMLYRAEQDVMQAMQRYRRALQLNDGLFEAHFNLGNLCTEFGDEEAAQQAFKRAADIAPLNAEAAYSLGVSESDPGKAKLHLGRALELRPYYPEAEVARVYNQLKACDWTDIQSRIERVNNMVMDPAVPALSPFWMLAMTDSRRVQLACARKWVSSKVMPGLSVLGIGEGPKPKASGSLPRIGFLSGDLRQHAVGELLRDVLPMMDGGQCELFAYDASPDDGSQTRRQLLAAFKTVRPIATLSVQGLASRIAADGIDVLVDLSGFTQHSRSKVLGLRPAPLQVSYLGFPGSMGWDAVDVMLADDHLVPALHEADYDERIVRLPHCYQPARRFDVDASQAPTRAQVGLPEDATVFACFGNAYKLRPEIFECWLRLLKRTPRSVLWFARFNEAAENNLRAFTRHHGVDPARLVFSPVVSLAAHSARLPLADLFLDTAPYGSGMTAAQTLHAGVPLLTIAGTSYVGRMASSVLRSKGLSALIAADLADYEGRALRLAQDPAARAHLRAQLQCDGADACERSAHDLQRTLLRLCEGARASVTAKSSILAKEEAVPT